MPALTPAFSHPDASPKHSLSDPSVRPAPSCATIQSKCAHSQDDDEADDLDDMWAELDDDEDAVIANISENLLQAARPCATSWFST